MIIKAQKYRDQLEQYFASEEDQKLLNELLAHAAYLYESLYRYSGESYFLRCLRFTVDKILPLHPDKTMIMASILVSACYSSRCDLDKIEKLFGKEVCDLVTSLGKINGIKSRYSFSDTRIISKMFLTLAKDFRVILIRLAERIENAETLQYKGVEKQKANAREILDVYVPIASRLGLYKYRLILEDLAFKYVYPQEYDLVKKDVDDYLVKSLQNIEVIKKELKRFLKENGIEVEVSGRLKNLYSLYKKLKRKTSTLDELYDVFAYRIILPTNKNLETDSKEDLEKLYAILSLLHKKYKYLPDRFKDYIMNPKKTGYQSLHTVVVGLDLGDPKKPVEIQIRTDKMHHYSESGKASHWLYKESQHQPMDEELMKALKELKANKFSDDRTAALKMDLFPDRIFVLTPDNLVKELPIDATPVDFAYSIHSDIGHGCYLAKVNGQVVSLDHALKSGDIVEIVANKKMDPKLSWLSFVKTHNAKNRIRNYFRGMDDGDLIVLGKNRINELLDKSGLAQLDENLTLLKKYSSKNLSMKEREMLLKEVGSGKLTGRQVFKNVMGLSVETFLKNKELKNRAVKSILPTKKSRGKKADNLLIIGGEENMPYRMSNCCKVKVTDDIVAYITLSKGVSIHKKSCKFIKTAGPNRILEAYLKSSKTEKHVNFKEFQVSLLLDIKKREGLVTDLVDFLNDQQISIVSLSSIKRRMDKETKQLVLKVIDEEQLNNISNYIGLLAGVEKITRI